MPQPSPYARILSRKNYKGFIKILATKIQHTLNYPTNPANLALMGQYFPANDLIDISIELTYMLDRNRSLRSNLWGLSKTLGIKFHIEDKDLPCSRTIYTEPPYGIIYTNITLEYRNGVVF